MTEFFASAPPTEFFWWTAGASVVTLGNVPYTGTIDDAGVNGFVPNFYYTRDLSSQLKFGFGVSVPFGLSTEYDNTWIGR